MIKIEYLYDSRIGFLLSYKLYDVCMLSYKVYDDLEKKLIANDY